MSNLALHNTLSPSQTPKVAIPPTPSNTSKPLKIADSRLNTPRKMQEDTLHIQARKTSPIIEISGGAATGSIIGGLTGASLMSLGDIAFNRASSVLEAGATGGSFGSLAGLASGALIAQVTDSKWKATLYGALTGAGTGAIYGGAKFQNGQAALVTGVIGAVSGASSAYATASLLGKE